MFITSESSSIRITRMARQAAANAATPNQTSTRRRAMTRAIKSLIRIIELPQLPAHLKSENKSFRSRNMTHLMSILSATGRTRRGEGANDLVAQFEPAAQLLRRALDRARPTATCERSVNFSKARVLSESEQRHTGAFREC